MQQDKPTINLTVPTGWDKLDDHQLHYVLACWPRAFPRRRSRPTAFSVGQACRSCTSTARAGGANSLIKETDAKIQAYLILDI